MVRGMRPFPVALAAALGIALGSAPASAADPPRLTLEVGASVATGGYSGRCDDLSVVSITVGPNATLTGLKPGKTLCSWAAGHVDGLRLVVEVVVVEAKAAPGKRTSALGSPKPQASAATAPMAARAPAASAATRRASAAQAAPPAARSRAWTSRARAAS